MKYEMHDGIIEMAMDHTVGHIDRDQLVSFIMANGYSKSEAMELAQESVDYVSNGDWS